MINVAENGKPCKTLLQAYADCVNENNDRSRCLSFRMRRSVNLNQLVALFQTATPGGYNAFEPSALIALGEVFGEKARYFGAREGSVCIYVKPANSTWIGDLKQLQNDLEIDEVTVEPNGEIRLWWD